MIIAEDYGELFTRRYSDQNVYIRKVGTSEEYIDAIDLKTVSVEYEETDRPIEEVIPDDGNN